MRSWVTAKVACKFPSSKLPMTSLVSLSLTRVSSSAFMSDLKTRQASIDVSNCCESRWISLVARGTLKKACRSGVDSDGNACCWC